MAYNPYYNWDGDAQSGINFGYKFFDILELVVQEACKGSIRGDVTHWYRTLRAWYRLISPWIKDTKRANNREKVEILFKMAHRLINDPANNVQQGSGQQNQQTMMLLGNKTANVQKAYLILDQIEMIMLDIMKEKNLLLPDVVATKKKTTTGTCPASTTTT